MPLNLSSFNDYTYTKIVCILHHSSTPPRHFVPGTGGTRVFLQPPARACRR